MLTNHRIAIYARVSTEEQAEFGYSIDAQLDTLRAYCNLHQKVIVGEYVDRGVSGKSIEGRYELQKLLRDAKQGLFDEVLVWKINRISRRTIDLLKIVEELGQQRITFRSFSENFETETAMGKFALQMLGAVGELERNTIVDNVRMGMKQRARSGQWNGGKVLGYRSSQAVRGQRHRKDSTLEIVPEEAAIVRKIFELYASGKGLKAIANQINREGHTTKRGNAFSTDSIKQIILNPVYVGKIRYLQHENWNERRRKGKNATPMLEDGGHEPIISEELWEKVQLLQKSKAVTTSRTFDGKYTLTGLLRCPQCGAEMVASRTVNNLKDGSRIVRRYYSCGNFKSKGSSVCSANSVKADYAESFVYQRLKEVINNERILADVISVMNQDRKGNTAPLQEELKAIHQKVESIEGKRQKYFGLFEDELVDRETLANRLEELKAEKERLLARKSEIEWELGNDNSQMVDFEYVRTILAQLDQFLFKASTEQIKSLLHLVIKQISVKNRKIEAIELNFDEDMQKHFLAAPSDDESDGAFSVLGPRPLLYKFNLVI
ncbi:MAG: recombinase family protein [Paenibacillus sp.]|uniref:recombinase family protein n=1 Tax=Paenibacillus sp. TaxID=58172 RepID=UPI0029038FC9|nr:recombinase family protein [Paenibacillus sp.]MDU2239745.1 recombinase family protein [Paenibacillus sp.]